MSSPRRPEDLSLKSALWDQEPHNLISIVLLGVRPAASRGSMPAFRDVLGEDDLIALASYLRRVRTNRPPWPLLAERARLIRASVLLQPAR